MIIPRFQGNSQIYSPKMEEIQQTMEADARTRARRIAEARYGFRWHALIYTFVNAGLVAIWFLTGEGFPWPIFPIVFWGIGLASHYMSAYHSFGRDWVERETEKILQQQTKKEVSGS